MELVWYRMLSPLLGGSTYTFGIILAVAVLEIGETAPRIILRRPRAATELDGAVPRSPVTLLP